MWWLQLQLLFFFFFFASIPVYKAEYVWNTGDPLGCLWVLQYPMIKSMENYNNPIKAGLVMTQTFQEWKSGKEPPGKEPRLAEVHVEGTRPWKKALINTSYIAKAMWPVAEIKTLIVIEYVFVIS